MLGKIISICAINLFLTVFATNTIFAQLNSTSEASLNNRTQLRIFEEVRDRIRQRTEERIATQQARLDAIRKRRFRTLFAITIKRIQAAIDRLENIIDRMQSRIDQMKNLGADTEKIQLSLDEQKSELSQAKQNFADIQDSFEELINSGYPKQKFDFIKDSLKDLKRQLINIHIQLSHLIRLMIGLHIGSENQNSQPTP